MNREPEPPQVKYGELARAHGWIDRQTHAAIWVTLEGYKVVLQRTQPVDPEIKSARLGIFNGEIDAAMIVKAIDGIAERLWRAAT